ncbi:DUF86 domain-containing protein [Dielma fastidiosa]|uniref:Uncharacterized protein with HEPN domain n=1 Tax=Dielma fastidiosa TaxID=1034346 RepID=A0A318KQD2_9FIRM|nr:HepT-like ribonuclease domain-containing protein [Dielma fastidiosa]PXX80021.1 uncharacterized protein with HEPN domain [Dielma fastidiosa]
MDNKKDNQYYIKKIVTDLEFIIEHTEGLTQSELEDNELLTDSVMFRLIQISENADRLTDNFKNQTSIPWRAVKGMRNRIVHEYGDVDLTVVYDTVHEDLPELLHELNKICKQTVKN